MIAFVEEIFLYARQPMNRLINIIEFNQIKQKLANSITVLILNKQPILYNSFALLYA